MCTFDFDLPNITSIDRRTVLCFTWWEKHLPRPRYKPGHEPPLHYPGCCWQAWDDESSMVCWGLDLITAVIYRQLPYPLTTAIRIRVIVVHRAVNLSVCYQGVYEWTELSKARHKGQSVLREEHSSICAHFSHISSEIRKFSLSFNLIVINGWAVGIIRILQHVKTKQKKKTSNFSRSWFVVFLNYYFGISKVCTIPEMFSVYVQSVCAVSTLTI